MLSSLEQSILAVRGILELPFKYFMLHCGFPTGIDGGGTVHLASWFLYVLFRVIYFAL